MRLLLDLGNTRLKWMLQAQADGWLARGVADWHDDDVAGVLTAAWAGLPTTTMVFAASVVDNEREAQLTAISRQLFAVAPQWLRTPAHACGVRNAYAEPGRLGVDRFLAMLAAFAGGHAPCVLAGVGTGLTLDALTADGQHLGGLIAPGPQLMQQSLRDATARVRPQHPGKILELADNTADAVSSGCWHAAAALIERFATRLRPRFDVEPTLILSGGDAPTLLPLLSMPARLSEDAVLRGLAVWADAQMSASMSD